MTAVVPKKAYELTQLQKDYLKGIVGIYNLDEEAGSLQVSLYELAKEIGISTKDAFSAIYIGFIGKTHGPRAGILLTSFGRKRVFERINEIIIHKVNEKTK